MNNLFPCVDSFFKNENGARKLFFLSLAISARYVIGLIFKFIFFDELLKIQTIYELLLPHLNIRQLAVPDLATPKPFGNTDFGHKLFYRVEPFCGHIMGTVSFNKLNYLLIFRTVGFIIPMSVILL